MCAKFYILRGKNKTKHSEQIIIFKESLEQGDDLQGSARNSKITLENTSYRKTEAPGGPKCIFSTMVHIFLSSTSYGMIGDALNQQMYHFSLTLISVGRTLSKTKRTVP